MTPNEFPRITVKAMLKSLTLLTYYLIPENHHFRKLTIEGISAQNQRKFFLLIFHYKNFVFQTYIYDYILRFEIPSRC